MGGGSNNGTDGYPEYIKQTHQELLFGWHVPTPEGDASTDFFDSGQAQLPSFNVMADLNAARSNVGGNPYTAVTSYGDTDADLDAIAAAIASLSEMVSTLIPDDLIGTAITAALAQFGGPETALAFRSYNADQEVDDAVTAALSLMGAGVLSKPQVAAFTNPAIPAPPGADHAAIDAAVNAFEARSQAAYQRGISNLAAGAFEIRAVMGSQFSIALALLESERQAQLNEFDTSLRQKAALEAMALTTQVDLEIARILMLNEHKEAELQAQIDMNHIKDTLDVVGKVIAARQSYEELNVRNDAARVTAALSLVTTQIDSAIRANALVLQSMYQTAGMEAEFYKNKIIVKNDQLQFDLQLEVKEALWDLELYDFGNKMLAAINGAATFPQPSKFERILNNVGQIASIGTGLFGTIAQLAAL